MPNLSVLGKLPEDILIKYANGYRGVCRMYIDAPIEYFGTNNHILKAFEDYTYLTNENIYIEDICFARNLRDVYNKIYPETSREIIEIVFNNEQSELNGKFLGYDIEDRGDSNILKIILPFYLKEYTCDNFNVFQKMLILVSKNVFPLLNENQLFKTYEDASMALSLLQGVFDIFGKSKFHHIFEVAGVYLVE